MSKRIERDQDIIYWAYDGRIVTRHAIEMALRELDGRRRRRERLQQFRTWALLGLVVLILLAASAALIWWRLTTPL
ncbi:MAG: hypothetical protein JOZ41_06760 [Chloroflexi bacterium]|jgi:hypothetical protein|nr:hypothetical protein [Chloroflexota bacterium]